MKIGFFDSGLGGLAVMKATRKLLPDYEYEFYGDTAHVPYGNRNEEEIFELTKIGSIHLFDRGCSIVIIACNTASAETLRKLQDEWLQHAYPGRKILGVIIPVVEELCSHINVRALLLATTRTVSSGKYHFELGKLKREDVKIEAQATPELVPLIENGELTKAITFAANYIADRSGLIDVVILGCTHYTALVPGLRNRFPGIVFIAQDEVVPVKLRQYLEKHLEIAKMLGKEGAQNLYYTGNS